MKIFKRFKFFSERNNQKKNKKGSYIDLVSPEEIKGLKSIKNKKFRDGIVDVLSRDKIREKNEGFGKKFFISELPAHVAGHLAGDYVYRKLPIKKKSEFGKITAGLATGMLASGVASELYDEYQRNKLSKELKDHLDSEK